MEHHFLPKNPTPPFFKVPYVCQTPYDGGLFSDYPNRVGKTWILPIEGQPLSFQRKHLHPEPTPQQESFYQTWLFFGLLNTLLGPLYHETDFISEDENGTKTITTAKLIPKMEEAARTRVAVDPKDQANQWLGIIRCLDITWAVIELTNRDFDWRIKLGIVSLASFVAQAINLFIKSKGLEVGKIAQEFYKLYFPNEVAKAHMLAHGWCPFEIAANIDRFNSLHTLFFLSRVDRSYLGRNHERCTERLCSSYQIDLETYVTKHTESGCACLSIMVDTDEVYRILLTGAIPLIKVVRNGEGVGVELVASGPGIKYVAFSHVWADGLGNPRENSLPECQVRRLEKLSADVFAKGSSIDGDDELTGPPLFWIDTLCCPAHPGPPKNLSITLIRSTYLSAHSVLILDSSLQPLTYNTLSPTQSILSIATSGWTQRLWTLQEAALAPPKKLFAQFSDGAQNLDVVYSNLGQPNIDVRIHHIRQDLRIQFGAGIRMSSLTKTKRPGHELMVLDRGLIHRSVSVASDEALCIATLLDLDLSEILDVVDPETGDGNLAEKRMCKVCELVARKIGGIPEGIITLSYPRLSIPGYKWAPSTLLTVNSPTLRDARWLDPELLELTPYGLEIPWETHLLTLTPTSDASHPDFAETLSDHQFKGVFPFMMGEKRHWIMSSTSIFHSRTTPKPHNEFPLLINLFNTPLSIINLPPYRLSKNNNYTEALLCSTQPLPKSEKK